MWSASLERPFPCADSESTRWARAADKQTPLERKAWPFVSGSNSPIANSTRTESTTSLRGAGARAGAASVTKTPGLFGRRSFELVESRAMLGDRLIKLGLDSRDVL